MILSSTKLYCTPLTCHCQSSQTSFVLKTSILLTLLLHSFRTSPFLFLHDLQNFVTMAPNAETEDIITMTSDFSKVHSLKAAIFHTKAFKLSLEINKNKITPKSLLAFLKGLCNVTQIKKKKLHLINTRAFILKAQKLRFAKRRPMSFSS